MSHSSDILSLTGEAAVQVRYGKIVFANAAAAAILGANCVGKTVRETFGPEVASAQASAFIAGVPIGRKYYIIRMTKMEAGQFIFFTCPDTAPAVLNDALLFFIRSTLMNLSISADKIRDRAEETGDQVTLRHVAALTRNYHRLNRLIANISLILDLSRGQLPVHISQVNLSALYGKLMESVPFFCPEVSFSTDFGQDIHCPVDTAMATSLFLNLLSNCLIHAKGSTRISIHLTDARENVILSVSDDGCGISPDRLHTVFDRYLHGFDINSMNSGVGLGLTVARSIAQLHGGTLLLESRQDVGTSVRASFCRNVRLPDTMRAPHEELTDYLRLTLIGLSDYLPIDCYSEKYMD